MATKLTTPVTRETRLTLFDSGQHRPVMITLRPPGIIELHLKGCRRKHAVTADGLYWQILRAGAGK